MEQMVVQLCLHPGVWDSSRYYLPDNYLPDTKYPTRTNCSVIKGASDAGKDGKVVRGIKIGQSSQGIIDLVGDVPIDYMQCVLEGVGSSSVVLLMPFTDHLVVSM